MRPTGNSRNLEVLDWQFPAGLGATRPYGLVGPMPLPEVVNVFRAKPPAKPLLPQQADNYFGATLGPDDQIKEQAARLGIIKNYHAQVQEYRRHMQIIDEWLKRRGLPPMYAGLYSGAAK